MAQKDRLGREGESLAAEYLERRGYTIVERNWRCRSGEVDIVAEHQGELVLVEVKTRSSEAFGHPFAAITPAKQSRLRRLAGLWREAHPGTGAIRIDAVAVLRSNDGAAAIEHLRAVC
ncbi:YraN family protein [Ruicaihuangia caeni]|uniref:UPF0102 protein QF206_01850 n=1 Tax=Ruicaihuangia caeni TaxID=3042517 RepID=A0AAW6T7C8_9MICO|nr:YraN family protein [Klugiella sp. YN-L-19]MDI2097713.1 YraN family protein [Klugiella sp. YN-L-19]